MRQSLRAVHPHGGRLRWRAMPPCGLHGSPSTWPAGGQRQRRRAKTANRRRGTGVRGRLASRGAPLRPAGPPPGCLTEGCSRQAGWGWPDRATGGIVDAEGCAARSGQLLDGLQLTLGVRKTADGDGRRRERPRIVADLSGLGCTTRRRASHSHGGRLSSRALRPFGVPASPSTWRAGRRAGRRLARTANRRPGTEGEGAAHRPATRCYGRGTPPPGCLTHGCSRQAG